MASHQYLFTEQHEWLRQDGEVVHVGITDHAQGELGDIVFVELPEPGRTVQKGEAIAVIESIKAASDIYAPIDGEIVSVNTQLDSEPGLVNSDPIGNALVFYH